MEAHQRHTLTSLIEHHIRAKNWDGVDTVCNDAELQFAPKRSPYILYHILSLLLLDEIQHAKFAYQRHKSHHFSEDPWDGASSMNVENGTSSGAVLLNPVDLVWNMTKLLFQKQFSRFFEFATQQVVPAIPRIYETATTNPEVADTKPDLIVFMIDELVSRVRQRLIIVTSQVYASIHVSQLASMLGMPPEDTIKMCTEVMGWSVQQKEGLEGMYICPTAPAADS
eukprot:CAMPEP_0184700592 /NCGR_PEP_ID=MMETSP0313-20130426/14623_1 /TAXON_ID=2792 /ORGANISM="Porphyridium aerugineum, Strain SAG 1380-2" /LENGTH=224 /DNA_ID=CAMNT_0027160341 /DNA_START=76 /DNA_END=747 /DNA_ORIENTATION=+